MRRRDISHPDAVVGEGGAWHSLCLQLTRECTVKAIENSTGNSDHP